MEDVVAAIADVDLEAAVDAENEADEMGEPEAVKVDVPVPAVEADKVEDVAEPVPVVPEAAPVRAPRPPSPPSGKNDQID